MSRLLAYDPKLKEKARNLRSNLTDSEKALWLRLRCKQLGVQVFRQRPIGNYIVDFFVPEAKLVIEVDGSQHMLETAKDRFAIHILIISD